MNSNSITSISSKFLASSEETFLIKSILMTHDPDGCQLDSPTLLHALKNIIRYTNPVSGSDSNSGSSDTNIWDVEANGLQDSLGNTIYMISQEALGGCYDERDFHTKTMLLFEILHSFNWDAKVILVLAAFLTFYGRFQLVVELQSGHALAALLASLRQLPCELDRFRAQFKVLTVLVERMIDLAQVIIEFESLPLQQELLEFEVLSVLKPKIYIASYWIFRSVFACFSVIKELKPAKDGQVKSFSAEVATWTLFSFVHKLNGLCSLLRKNLEKCHQQTGKELYKKLIILFKHTHSDNQETLNKLIPFVDKFPLKDCLSQAKHGISELKNKVVILLLSPVELLPIEKIFLLVQQTYDHPNRENFGGSFLIIWIPIPTSSSRTWSRDEEISFHFLSHSLPFWSLRKPWCLNSAVLSFVEREWSYKSEAMMVVMDTNGSITNPNAMDMLWIWGADAFPFSSLREKKLLEAEKWSLQIITNGIDPFLTKCVDEEKNVCIFASDNIDWIREFTSKVKEIKKTGFNLEMAYVGWMNHQAQPLQKNILDVIKQEKLSPCLNLTRQSFFWDRLSSMKNSITRNSTSGSSDHILKEVSELMDAENNVNGWVLIGKGSFPGMVKLNGTEAIKCFDHFGNWAEKVEEIGLVSAIKTSIEEPSQPDYRFWSSCHRCDVFPYKEGPIPGTVFCPDCKRPMEKFIVYKSEETE